MSCVFPENPPQQFAAESAASDPRAQMAEGLHAMAQPLTILRGALCAVSMKEAVSIEQQRYLEMSARQVTRLSNMLHTLRDVLDLDQSEPECVELDLTALIARAVEEMESTLGESGVTVEMPEIDGPVRAWADPQKTERAVRAVLRVAVAQAAPGAAIRFRASRANVHRDRRAPTEKQWRGPGERCREDFSLRRTCTRQKRARPQKNGAKDQ